MLASLSILMDFSPQFLPPWIINISSHGDIQDLWLQINRSKFKYVSRNSTLAIAMIVILRADNSIEYQLSSQTWAHSAHHSLRPQTTRKHDIRLSICLNLTFLHSSFCVYKKFVVGTNLSIYFHWNTRYDITSCAEYADWGSVMVPRSYNPWSVLYSTSY